MPGSSFILVSPQPTAEPARSKPALAREATGLWGTLAFILLVVVIGLALIALLRRAVRLRAQANRTPTPTKVVDAWTESGKRLPPDPPYMHGPEHRPDRPPPNTPDSSGNYQPPKHP
ncbi:MAG: hypothetical protein KGS45_06720 [Planctomycetes bacterium]|nr:hypothetical protein [Planctomycetota bacterium]